MIKNCFGCNQRFEGRPHAKTCSTKCRMRLMRMAQATTNLAHKVGAEAKGIEQSLETSAQALFANQGGFAAGDTAVQSPVLRPTPQIEITPEAGTIITPALPVVPAPPVAAPAPVSPAPAVNEVQPRSAEAPFQGGSLQTGAAASSSLEAPSTIPYPASPAPSAQAAPPIFGATLQGLTMPGPVPPVQPAQVQARPVLIQPAPPAASPLNPINEINEVQPRSAGIIPTAVAASLQGGTLQTGGGQAAEPAQPIQPAQTAQTAHTRSDLVPDVDPPAGPPEAASGYDAQGLMLDEPDEPPGKKGPSKTFWRLAAAAFALMLIIAGVGFSVASKQRGKLTVSQTVPSQAADPTLGLGDLTANLPGLTLQELFVQGNGVFKGDLAVHGGDITLGDPSDPLAFTGTIAQGPLTAAHSYTLPDQSGAFCLNTGNCLGGAGGGANTALSNLSNVAINTSLLPGPAAIDLGNNARPFRDLFLSGTVNLQGHLAGTTAGFSGDVNIGGVTTLQGHLIGTTAAFSGNVSGADAINTDEFVTLGQLTTVSAGNFFIQHGNSFGTTAMLGTNDSFDLAFETAGTEKMRILTNGNVGIGLTAPSSLLHLGSDALTPASGIKLGSAGDTYLYRSAAGILRTDAEIQRGDISPRRFQNSADSQTAVNAYILRTTPATAFFGGPYGGFFHAKYADNLAHTAALPLVSGITAHAEIGTGNTYTSTPAFLQAVGARAYVGSPVFAAIGFDSSIVPTAPAIAMPAGSSFKNFFGAQLVSGSNYVTGLGTIRAVEASMSGSNASASVTDAMLFYGSENLGSSVVTNKYGLWLGNITGATTINRAIHTAGGEVRHLTGAAGVIGMVIQGAASQTADLLQVLNSGGTELFSIESGGIVFVPNLGAAGATSVCRNASNQLSTCSGAGGSDPSVTLQNAYNNGNTITTTDARDIEITLQDTATDQTFEITQAGTADILRLNDDGTFTDSTPFVVDASGNASIGGGLTVRGTNIEVTGEGNGGTGWINSNGAGGLVFTTFGAGTPPISLLAGGDIMLMPGYAEALRVTTGGNVGIGTTGPDSKLHVVGGGICVETSDTGCAALSGGISLQTLGAAGATSVCRNASNQLSTCSGAGGSDPSVTLQNAYNNSTNPEIILNSTNGALTIRDNATPIGANLLEVQNNAGTTTYLAVTSSATTLAGNLLPAADDTYDLGSPTLRWRDLYLGPTSLHIQSTAAETTTARDWALAIQETDGTSEGNLRLTLAGADLVNVTPAGNVGIGTTNPQAKLHVQTAASTDLIFAGKVAADTFDRFSIDAAGKMEWGGGAAARDVTLSRVGANALRVLTPGSNTGSFTIGDQGSGLYRLNPGLELRAAGVDAGNLTLTATTVFMPATIRLPNTTVFAQELGGSGTPTVAFRNVNGTNTRLRLDVEGAQQILGQDAASVVLLLKGAAAQTADLLQLQNSAGSPVFYVNASGGVFADGNVDAATDSVGRVRLTDQGAGIPTILFGSAEDTNLYRAAANLLKTDDRLEVALGADITTGAATTIGLVVKGAASQTADLQQWQNSAGTVLARVDASGNGFFANGAGGATLQAAYDAGNTITTTDARDIEITLQDTTTDQTFEITQAGTALAFRVNDDGTFTDTSPFVIDATGKVGIGTDAPANTLDVKNSTGNVLISVETTADSNSYIYFDRPSNARHNALIFAAAGAVSASNVDWYQGGFGSTTTEYRIWNYNGTSDTSVLTAKLGGNVGIGPGSAATGATTARLVVQGSTTDSTAAVLNAVDSAGTSRLYVRNDGNVGIGNTAPSTKLHVTGGARITGLVSCDTIDTDANGVLACGTDAGAGGATLQAAYDAGNTITTTDARDIEITLQDTATDQTFEITQAGTANAFRVNDDGTFTDSTPFVIDATGRVGIGEAVPGAQLQINTGTTSTINLIVKAIASQSASLTQWQDSAGAALTLVETDGSFRTTRDIRVRSTGGNVGVLIGSHGEGIGFQFDGDSRIWRSGVDQLVTSAGWTFGSSNGPSASTVRITVRAASSQTADLMQWQNSVGTVLARVDASGNGFFANGSGGTGAAFVQGGNTFGAIGVLGTNDAFDLQFETGGTTKMTVQNSSGNVGIGDTTPDAKLDVEPTGAVTATSYAQRIENLQTNITTDAIDKYGLHITSTGAFTGGAGVATNNYGLFVATPTGGDNNYAAIFAGGNVGIGDSTPTQLLEVNGSAGVGDLKVFGTLDGYGGDLEVDTALIPTADNTYNLGNSSLAWSEVYVTFLQTANNTSLNITPNGTGDIIFNLDADTVANFIGAGNVGIGTSLPEAKLQVTGGGLCVGSDANCNTDNNTEGVVYSSSTSMTLYDVAENYPTRDEALAVADLVSLDTTNSVFVKQSTGLGDNHLIGVVSTAPGVLLGGFNGAEFSTERQVAVALSGRVPVKVSTENGPIAIGDPITTSSVPGVGMKATANGRVVGMALEGFDGPGEGKIVVFVNPSWYAPTTSQMMQGSSGAGNFESLNVSGPSTLERLVVQGPATIEGTLTVAGAATFKGNIIIEGHIIGNPDTRGEVTIISGQIKTRYDFAKPYDSQPYVVVSPINLAVLYRVEVDKTGFTIYLDAPMAQDLKFNYMVQQ